MMETKAITVKKQFFEGVNKHPCPDCRGEMVEVNRVNENDFSFIWYECTRAGWGEQWLDKKPVNWRV